MELPKMLKLQHRLEQCQYKSERSGGQNESALNIKAHYITYPETAEESVVRMKTPLTIPEAVEETQWIAYPYLTIWRTK